MLFIYPLRALAENWLNATVVQILSSGMEAILSGRAPNDWRDVLPAEYKPTLQGRHGIKRRLEKFWTEYRRLSQEDQRAMLDVLVQQTSLPEILFNDVACAEIDNFPDSVKIPAIELFRFLFETQLRSIVVDGECLRDAHYNVIYAGIPSHTCPFCGIGYFRAPGAPRNALDHYLPITKYPFVGADLHNLPPMCSECNSDFKRNKDILYDEHGRRRRCVDPYNGPTYRVSLARSLPFAGSIQEAIHLPMWEVDFIGGPEEQAENWDRIFNIRERYKRDILDAEFRSWLEHFVYWYLASHHGRNAGGDVAAYLPEYIDTVIQDGLADRAFLKVEVFRLLLNECNDPYRGNDMRFFLQDLVEFS